MRQIKPGVFRDCQDSVVGFFSQTCWSRIGIYTCVRLCVVLFWVEGLSHGYFMDLILEVRILEIRHLVVQNRKCI